MSNKRELDTAYFISFCVEQYKMRQNMSGEETMSLFEKYDLLPYLTDNYDVLHTQSCQWIMEEIDDFISDKKNGMI